MKKRIIKIVLSILILVVGAFHIAWFYNYSKYKPFKDAVGKNEWGGYYCLDENKTTFAVFPPKYPRFVGNLSITEFQGDDLKVGDKLVDMIIWPKNNDKYEIGISIRTIAHIENSGDRNEGMHAITADSVSYMLDERMNFLKSYNDKEIALFNQNKEIIEEYYEKAYKMWGILGIKG